MPVTAPSSQTDCTIVGASFAGLSCAAALAGAGVNVVVAEKKSDPGEKLHTTGIIVKEAVDEISLLEGIPGELVRRIDGVRLYAPNLRHVDLFAPGYYFLATDTPQLMRWLATRVEGAGAKVICRAPFQSARRVDDGFDLGPLGTTRYLIGADGPNSQVAKSLSLGRNSKFLFGVEHEYAGPPITEADKLHCFMDRRLAPGYIAWVVPGVHVTQVGLARRVGRGRQASIESVMSALLDKISPLFDFRDREPVAVRAGKIPCGGLVHPVAAEKVLLIGDAAGMVSPVTAGGIHTALKHGHAAGEAVAEFLAGRRPDPCTWFVRSYPRFRTKRLLRFAFDYFQSDTLFNLLLNTRPMRTAAGIVYFNHKGVFRP
jgi:digeranylgeranylglycerophospholipid reductase